MLYQTMVILRNEQKIKTVLLLFLFVYDSIESFKKLIFKSKPSNNNVIT